MFWRKKKIFGILQGLDNRKIEASSLEEMKKKASRIVKDFDMRRSIDLLQLYDINTGERLKLLTRINRIADNTISYGIWQ